MHKIDDIRATLLHASLCYEAWWIFTEENSNNEHIEIVYNHYLDFFNTIQPALWCTFIIKISSLFGSRKDEINLKILPNIKSYPEFIDLWERGKKLHKYRSKVIAHRDLNASPQMVVKEINYTYDDVKKILDDTILLFNKSAIENKHNNVSNTYSCQDDLDRLIADLYRKITI